MWTYRCLIVPDAQVAFARDLSATVAGPAGAGMWTTPLSPTGAEPATHWISTGYISQEFAHMVPCQTWEQVDGEWVQTGSEPGSPEAVHQACTAAGMEVTLEGIQAVFAGADVTAQEPFTALARLGLVMLANAAVG